MNAVFLAAVLIAFVVAGYRQLAETPADGATAPMDALGLAMIEAAKGSVTLAIGLVGVLAQRLEIIFSCLRQRRRLREGHIYLGDQPELP